MKSLAVLMAVLLVGTIIAATNVGGKEPISGTITRPRSQAIGGTLLIDLIGILLIGGVSLVGLFIVIAAGLIFVPVILLILGLILGVVIGAPLLIASGLALVLTLLIGGPLILIGGLLIAAIIVLFLAAVGTLVISCLAIGGLLILAGLFIGAIVLLGVVGLPLILSVFIGGTCLILAGGTVGLITSLVKKIICLPCNLLYQPCYKLRDLIKKALI